MNPRVVEELDYCVPRGIPHSKFLSWSELDQDKALAWVRRQAEFCRGCGTRREDWLNDRFAFVAESEICPGCEVMEQEKSNVPKESKGVHIRLVPFALANLNPEED